MKGKKKIVRALMLLALVPSAAMAEVPHRFNLQSIVYDGEGNVTASEKVNVSVRIVDEDGSAVWEETHDGVVVVEGAINVVIGETNPLQPEVLDPTEGVKFIDVQVEGHNPFELLPLGAVPYAMWAEKALTVADDAIESRHIKNGTIKAEDIDPLAFSDIQGTLGDGQLPTSAATVAQLNNHLNSATAHPASAIVVSGPFITMVAGNAQEGFRKLDGKLADEIVNRRNMMIDSAHIVDGTIVNADVSPTAAIATSKLSGPVTSIAGHGLGTLATLSAVSGGSGGTITDGTITGDDIENGTIKAEDLASGAGGFDGWDKDASDDITTSGGTISGGDLTMSGRNIVMSGVETVDGVDVGASIGQLNQRVFSNADPLNHEDRIGTLEGDPLPDNVRDFQMTFIVNSIGGDSSSNMSFGGADASAWSVCDGGCDTDNDAWIYTDRNQIVVPDGCVAMASGTIAANPNSYETPASGGFRADNSGYLRISYSDTRTVRLRANAIGDDGYFEVNVRVIAFPATASADCRGVNWSY